MISDQLRDELLAFRKERDWEQFHNLRTLSTSSSPGRRPGGSRRARGATANLVPAASSRRVGTTLRASVLVRPSGSRCGGMKQLLLDRRLRSSILTRRAPACGRQVGWPNDHRSCHPFEVGRGTLGAHPMGQGCRPAAPSRSRFGGARPTLAAEHHDALADCAFAPPRGRSAMARRREAATAKQGEMADLPAAGRHCHPAGPCPGLRPGVPRTRPARLPAAGRWTSKPPCARSW